MVRLQRTRPKAVLKSEALSQFHYGSITTRHLPPISVNGNGSLNSTMVRLQLKKIISEKALYVFVSIPLWFDYNNYGNIVKGYSVNSLNSTMVRLQLSIFSLMKAPKKNVSIPLWFDYNQIV